MCFNDFHELEIDKWAIFYLLLLKRVFNVLKVMKRLKVKYNSVLPNYDFQSIS